MVKQKKFCFTDGVRQSTMKTGKAILRKAITLCWIFVYGIFMGRLKKRIIGGASQISCLMVAISLVSANLVNADTVASKGTPSSEVYASPKARARAITLTELKTFGPGFGGPCTETHCIADNTFWPTCVTVECCYQASTTGCEQDVKKEQCVESGCGGLFDPCDKECVETEESCGDQMVFTCLPGECKKLGHVVGYFGGGVIPGSGIPLGSPCPNLFTCETQTN